MSTPNYYVEVVERRTDGVRLSLALSHDGVVDVGSDRVFGWRLLQEVAGRDAYPDDARERAAAEVRRVTVGPVIDGRETSRDARAIFVDAASWVDEDTPPTFHIDVEVAAPSALAGIEVGAECDSYACPDDGAPLLEGD